MPDRTYQRRIVVRVGRRVVGYVDTTNCGWCREDDVCSACSARAEAMRKKAARG